MEINVKKFDEKAIIPTKAHRTDAGYDLYACLLHNGIHKKKIVVVDDYRNNLLKKIKNNSKGNIYSMVFVDTMGPILESLKEVK